jgi:cyclic beta-1,2-glucan synthetase
LSVGYIQAYPPGVRENGGQYSHGGVWALMAQAQFQSELAKAPTVFRNGEGHAGDTVYRYFTYLSPAHRARHPSHGAAYGIEPYVMAGDVYTQPPYVGRGGWSWYTGSAAWMHRAAIESIFGLHQRAQSLCLWPCLPRHWPRAELALQRDGRSMRFILVRATAANALQTALPEGERHTALLLRRGEHLHWPDLALHTCFVVPLLDDDEQAA